MILANDECNECHTAFSTDIFTISAGRTVVLNEFTDFNGISPQSTQPPGLFPDDVLIFGGPSYSNGCSGTAAGANCAFFGSPVPIWTQVEFSSPSGYHTKIGDQNASGGCQPSIYFNDPNSSFIANW